MDQSTLRLPLHPSLNRSLTTLIVLKNKRSLPLLTLPCDAKLLVKVVPVVSVVAVHPPAQTD